MADKFALTDDGMYNRAVGWNTTFSNPDIQKELGVSADDCAVVCKACTGFTIALDDLRSNGGPGKVHIKNDAKRNCKNAMSFFANKNIRYNPNVPHDLLIKLGMLPPDEVKKSHERSDVGPESKIVLNGLKLGVIGVRYIGAKPAPNCFCQIRWSFGPDVPASVEAMEKWDEEVFPHNTWEHAFLDKRGQMFHYVLRWVYNNGETSQWSAVQSCSVP
jgi:hypothetical protein